MAGASIDDEWGELIGDELSGPRPIGPTAKSHDAVGVPEPLEAEPDEAVDAVPVPKKKGTPGKAVVPPPPRLGARSPERRTDSVLAVPRDASSSRSGMRRVSKKGESSSSGRFATRRMLVPAPPKPVPKVDSDELPITVEDGGALPDVPSWGGQRESKPVTIPPTLVPAATDELAIPVSEPADPSGTLDLKSVSHLVPKAAEAPKDVAEEDSDVISVEPVPVRDSDVIEVSPAVPKTVTEAVPRVVSDLAALAEREVLESDEEPQSDGVPEFGALDDVIVEPSSRAAKFEPELAMTETGGWKPLMPWILGSAALLLLGSFAWMSGATKDAKEQTEVAASAVAQASKSNKAAPTNPTQANTAEPKQADAVPAAAAAEGEPAQDEPEGAEPAGADEPAQDEPAQDEPAQDEPAEPKGPGPAAVAPAAPQIPAVDPGAAKRYADASAQYDNTSDQESLEMMAIAACAMDDGVKARSAFRKLVGGDRRGRVMVDCRKRGVDVTAKGDEATPEEILRQAERALAAGDPDKAEELARTSNRMERSQAAILLTAVAACADGRVDRAVSLRRHLSSANRKTLKARCPGLPES